MVAFRALDETVDAATSVVCPGLSGVLPGYGARNSPRVWPLGGRGLAGADGCDPDGALGPVDRPDEALSTSISKLR